MSVLLDAGVVGTLGASAAAVGAYVVQQVRSAPTVEQLARQRSAAEFERRWRREYVQLQASEVVLPVTPRLSQREARVEARLRRFNIPSSQRAELIRTLDPDEVCPLGDAMLRSLLPIGAAPHRSLVVAGAPLPCGYCSVLDRPCACRR